MWEMFTGSVRLFLRGKLFRDPRAVVRQWSIGVLVCALLTVGLARVGVPIGWVVLIASFAVGALQPILFKDLKYN